MKNANNCCLVFRFLGIFSPSTHTQTNARIQFILNAFFANIIGTIRITQYTSPHWYSKLNSNLEIIVCFHQILMAKYITVKRSWNIFQIELSKTDDILSMVQYNYFWLFVLGDLFRRHRAKMFERGHFLVDYWWNE